ncbi:MAG: O-antigen ligase family protein [Candidatus Buchananbacteria bacterium]
MKRLNSISKFLFGIFLFLIPISTVLIIEEQFVGGFKFQFGSFNIYLVEIILWLAIVLYFVVNIKKISETLSRVRLRYSLQKIIFYLVLAVIVISAVSIFWSIDKRFAFLAFFRILEVIAVFSFFRLNYSKKYLWILFASGVVQSLFAIYQFFSQQIAANKYLGLVGHQSWEAGALVMEGSGRWLRSYGFVNDPNLLGGFMAFALFIAIFLYLKESKNYKRLLILSGIVFVIVGLFFSFSRSAWLGVIVGIIISLVFTFKNKTDFKKIAAVSLSGIIIFCILGFLFYPIISGRVLINNRLEHKSISERVLLINESTQIIKSNIFGVGVGNYTFSLLKIKPGQPGWSYQPVHNIYLLILAEIGVIGFVLYLLICFLAIIYAIRHKKFIFLGLFVSLLIIGFWDHYLWSGWQGMALFWLCFGLVATDQIN